MLDEKRMNHVLEKLDTDQMLITDPFAYKWASSLPLNLLIVLQQLPYHHQVVGPTP